MTILVTGAAGFIGFHVVLALRERGESVIGVDNLNAYYDPALKAARLERLAQPGFAFVEADIGSPDFGDALGGRVDEITGIIHLAAQAGVRYSMEAPLAYIRDNILGHTAIAEFARRRPKLTHLVYASSSSVYGASESLPYSLADRADEPVSLYAATKRADELISSTYAHLYGLPQTGLRFFTVYGPWGRPDMAYYLFTDAIENGRPLTLYDGGRLERDFTWIDDVVAGVIAALDRPPSPEEGRPHRVYNIGDNSSEPVHRMVSILEAALGKKAIVNDAPMPPGDVRATYADIDESRRALGYDPVTSLEEGLNRFVDWYREHDGGRYATR